MLLATLLPLKIIILLGSDGIPRYFPASFAQYDRGQLIIWLSIATVAFYMAHLIAEKLVSICSSAGSRKLVSRTRKVALFDDQDELASSGYRTYARALAGGVFTFLVIALLFWLYRDAGYMISGYIAVCMLFLGLIYKYNARVRSGFSDFLPGAVSVLSTIGFLSAFGFIVAQFMLGHPVPLLAAIITMLLSRQMFSRLSTVVGSALFLLGNRLKLNSLFFHTQVYVEREHPQQEDFFTRFTPDSRDRWLRELFAQFVPGVKGHPRFEWHQSGMPSVASFWVSVDGDSPDYLLRFYAPIRKPWAMNEATLLSEKAMCRLPAPKLLISTPFEDLHVSLFELPNVKIPSGKEHRKHVIALNAELMMMVLPSPLITRFSRSRPMLGSRMERNWVERIRMAANTASERHLIDELSRRWDHIRGTIENLPVMLVNQQTGLDNMVVDEPEGRPLLLGWGQWAIEPIGFTWGPQPKAQQQSVNDLKQLQNSCEKLNEIDVEAACLVARMKHFESLYVRQLYRSAIDFVPDILDNLQRCRLGQDALSLSTDSQATTKQ
jgi:hypothetical protein